MVGATTDITERKLADQALRELSATLQNAVEGIARSDADGIIISTNPAFARLAGRNPEELIGMPWSKLFHPHDQARLAAAFHEMRLHGKVQVEARCIHKDGAYFHSELVMMAAIEHGKQFAGHYTFLKDITEQKQAESEIRKLAAFPRFNPYAVMELANDGSLSYYNDAAIDIARAIGKDHPSQILPPNVAEIVDECLRTRRSRVRLELQQGDRTVSWSFFPVMSLRIVHCYASDITDRLALENQLRQSQKMESIGQLAAGVAHDFNNILNIIMGYTNLLQVEKGLPEDAVDSLKQILTASQRASSLTRQLLTFSRRQVMQTKAVQLNQLVRSIVEMFPRSLSMQVRIDLMDPDVATSIRGDSGMIEQVVMNLVLNARDAMDANGVLTLRTSRRVFTEEDAQRGHEIRKGDFVRLEVQDTGCGIPPENVARIFEPFFTTKEVGRGTGLGLATVYGIIKQHEGWVSVESEVGKGTRFFVHLPYHEASDEAVAPRGEETHAAQGRETILVVEDEAPLRELIVKSLTHSGYSILAAANGVEGWELWQKERKRIDLVFTDLVMPGGMSGRELGEKIRAAGSRIPVIYTSGYSPDMLGSGFAVKEGENFLGKPYGQDKLRAILHRALDRRGAG
jgi:PAS domain S-box-containing protein